MYFILEIFATVFTLSGWDCWFNMVDPMINVAGWGYDFAIRDFCNKRVPGFKIGIIDAMEATHNNRFGKISNSFHPPYSVNVPNAEMQYQNWIQIMKNRRNETVTEGTGKILELLT